MKNILIGLLVCLLTIVISSTSYAAVARGQARSLGGQASAAQVHHRVGANSIPPGWSDKERTQWRGFDRPPGPVNSNR